MSIDGIMLAAIKSDLEKKLIGARLDKIYQPEEQSLTFTLRQSGENIKLLVSAHPQRARLHITKMGFENPVKPPDFCMLLRKYLLRGIITEITQPDFERILNFQIKLRNNTYNLIVEIMGKYSNVILVDEKGVILDAIKRITAEISRERQLYPGIRYKYPPKQDKLNPLLTTRDNFEQIIPVNFGKYSFKAVMCHFRGIGPDMAKEIIHQAGLDPEQPYADFSSKERERIWLSFNSFFSRVKNNDFKPAVGLDEKENIIYISAFPLKHKKDTIRELVFNDTGELLDYFYEHKLKKDQLKQMKAALLGVVRTYLSKNRKKQTELKEKLKEGQNAERYQKLGELVKANIYRINKRAEEIEVIDYYDPEQKTVTISLDPKLTPAENAQRYFKKYHKAKRSIKHLKKQLGRLRHEEKYLEQVSLNIEQAENKGELKEIREELKDEGYIKEKQRGRKKKKQDQPLPPHHFKSSEGYDILVGRNNRQNDYLTKKIASKNDLWLHIKEEAGSHVIIRNHTGEEIPEKTIKEAASLAAYFSKGRMSENVPIDYTEVKNVRKPKGAKPGLVYYENYQTIYVNPDKELVKKISRS